MMLDKITPLILTFNEEANVERLLAGLHWATRIIVIDSGSSDATLAMLAADPRVVVHHRPFDNHWNQWAFAIDQCDDGWILRLDADYFVTQALVDEIVALRPDEDVAAYRIAFGYAMWGRVLPGSLYPANHILFRMDKVRVVERGHTEGWEVTGKILPLRGRVIHDDRKPMAAFVAAQSRYMAHEATAVENGKPGWASRLRRHPPLMVIAVFFYCLIVKRLIFAGPAGWMYVMQRVVAEGILALTLLERRFQRKE
mgnify:CR=1 FL=1